MNLKKITLPTFRMTRPAKARRRRRRWTMIK
jgi:hypothetical protein